MLKKTGMAHRFGIRLFIILSVLSGIRPGAVSGQNYDESKVGSYTLPDPLLGRDGRVIADARTWEQVRRPELLKLFEEHVYGRMPKTFDRIGFRTTREAKGMMNGSADLKETAITIARGGRSVTINLVMFLPSRAEGPVPVFLLINNRSVRNTAPDRDTLSDFWPAEKVIAAGYGVAAFQVNDAAPDRRDTFQNGVMQLYPEELQRPDGMKAIGSWAWAASRVMDYFESEKRVDARRVALVGHSRGGKTSLWACAQDTRFAICISNNSGNTGAALSRRNFGETVERINTSFPHWFADNYKKYNGRESELPVDQHMLIALAAPRPVYVTNATRDLWADPTGTYLALLHARPVFRLYGPVPDLPETLPAAGSPYISLPLSYHLREGKHNLEGYDWENFIRLAQLHFK